MPRVLSEDEFNALRDSVIAQAPQGLDEKNFNLWFQPRMEAALGRAENSAAPVTGSAVGRFVSNAADVLNPIAAVEGLASAVAHPIDTVTAIGNQSLDQLHQARDLARQGRYTEAAGHALGALPLIGPQAVQAGEQIASGDVAGGLGRGVGLIVPVAAFEGARAAGRAAGLLPKTTSQIIAERLDKLADESIAPKATATTAKVPASDVTNAVAFGRREGVPIDAATATQNRAVAAIQHLSDRTIGGSLVAQRADQATAQGLTAAGERLASRVSLTPATAESAGTAARNGVESAVRKFATDAEDAYTRAEALAAQKAQTVQTGTQTIDTGLVDAQGNPITRTQAVTATLDAPVDFGRFKKAVQPLYDRLSREAQLVPLQGPKARALTALDRVMRGPDMVSLMDAERASSDLGALAGSPELPELRNAGQASAAQAFKQLRGQIDRAANAAGSDVLEALQEGRTATKAKYATADILDSLGSEPVRTTNRLTAPKDVAIEQLRDVASVAPSALPQIGRAVVDGMMANATEAGRFDHAARLYSQWQNLGPQTKALLFGKTTEDLDRFFLLAKKLAENPNPSGTAHVVSMGAQGAAMFAEPIAAISAQIGGAGLSAALRNPTAIRLLNRALSLELGKAPAAARRVAWQAVRQVPLADAGVLINQATSPSESQSRSTGPVSLTP